MCIIKSSLGSYYNSLKKVAILDLKWQPKPIFQTTEAREMKFGMNMHHHE